MFNKILVEKLIKQYIDDKTILKNNIYKYYSDKDKYPDLYLI